MSDLNERKVKTSYYVNIGFYIFELLVIIVGLCFIFLPFLDRHSSYFDGEIPYRFHNFVSPFEYGLLYTNIAVVIVPLLSIFCGLLIIIDICNGFKIKNLTKINHVFFVICLLLILYVVILPTGSFMSNNNL